ncbi:hypothetical protein C8Q70DRAFT_964521 [Cubamyces menziesii]|nr:hypothetical protein C8Q70DRAFT_964521 [Cubamyces menziesii]
MFPACADGHCAYAPKRNVVIARQTPSPTQVATSSPSPGTNPVDASAVPSNTQASTGLPQV